MNQPDKQNIRQQTLASLIENSSEMPITFTTKKMGEWELPAEEGKLSIDVAETDTEILVVSTMAGAEFDAIDVNVHNDVLTIRGRRYSPLDNHPDATMLCQECFWGGFSRTVILPTEVKVELVRAEYRNGVLSISLPKRKGSAKIKVKIIEE